MLYTISNETVNKEIEWPLTALKPSDRARYGYANCAEVGYHIQSLILAYRVGIISLGEAFIRIQKSVSTIESIQRSQSYHGLLYPFYKLTDSAGVNLAMPDVDLTNSHIHIGDNALPSFKGTDQGRPIFEFLNSFYASVALYEKVRPEMQGRSFQDDVLTIPERTSQIGEVVE